MAHRPLSRAAVLTFDRSDLARLRTRMQQMKAKDAKGAARKAAGKAMLPVRRAAKAGAAYDPDTPAHVRTEVAMRGRWIGDTLVMRVGIRGGAKENPDSPFWFRLEELGTRYRSAKPFLVPALQDNEQQVYDALVNELKRTLFA